MAVSIQQLYRNHVVLLCSVLVPVLTVLLTYIGVRDGRAVAARELQIQATMLASELVNYTVAGNTKIETVLEHLLANPALQLGCLLDEDGHVRASVQGSSYSDASMGASSCDPSVLEHLAASQVVARVRVTNPMLPNTRGEVMLLASGPSIFPTLVKWLGLSGLIGLFVAALSWFLGQGLERALLAPMRQIATTAQRVSLYKDYSLRVVVGALAVVPREIEALTDSFNAMLHEIEDRDTRLTRKSEELEKSRHMAVIANNAKSQFLANVSHELRTPLNAIIGFSTMLEGEQFGPIGNIKYKEYARDIHDSGRHLLDVINDILDLTKAETGKLSVTFEPLNILKILEKAFNIAAGQAHERRVDIYTDVPERLPKIYADRVRLVQILLNLLSNAIKFSHEGGKIIVRVHAEAGKNGIHYFTIEIEDYGIGMTPAEVQKAFSTFNQSDAGLNRKYDGAGLGLPLTKRLVELHHGKIKIESEKDRGTLVTVRLTSDPDLLDA